jgi:hypothetical protein
MAMRGMLLLNLVGMRKSPRKESPENIPGYVTSGVRKKFPHLRKDPGKNAVKVGKNYHSCEGFGCASLVFMVVARWDFMNMNYASHLIGIIA